MTVRVSELTHTLYIDVTCGSEGHEKVGQGYLYHLIFSSRVNKNTNVLVIKHLR